MRHFFDAEFNGFGGPLISLALVPEDPRSASFYQALTCAEPTSWVAEHVLPVLRTQPVTRPEMVRRLCAYLTRDAEPVLVADWPYDIAQLALLMVTGPGYRMPLPRLLFELLDVPLFDSAASSEVPHNALYDAFALRDYVLADWRPSSRRRDLRQESMTG
jgi:hypothetical protein